MFKIAGVVAAAYALLSGTAQQPDVDSIKTSISISTCFIAMSRDDKKRLYSDVKKELVGEREHTSLAQWQGILIYLEPCRRLALRRWMERLSDKPVFFGTPSSLTAAAILFGEIAYGMSDPALSTQEDLRAVAQRRSNNGSGEVVINRNVIFDHARNHFRRYDQGMSLLHGFLFRPWNRRRYVLDALIGPSEATIYDCVCSGMIVAQRRPSLARDVTDTLRKLQDEVDSLHSKELVMAARALIKIYNEAYRQSKKKSPIELAEEAFTKCMELYPSADKTVACTYFKHGVRTLLTD